MTEALKVVDPHFHLWDLTTGNYPHFETPSEGFIGSNAAIARSYLWEEFLAEGGGAVELVGAVHVEAIPVDPLRETEYMQAVADRAGVPLGIVARADLTAPDIGEVLDRHAAAAPALRGVRQILNRHQDPLYNYVDTDFMRAPGFDDGLRALATRGLVFDLQIYPGQMEEAAALAVRHQELAFVLNHAGMWVDRTLAGWRAWRDGLRRLAACDNVSVKISGLGMFDREWTNASIRPLVLETLDAFGAGRAMFASNFPVDKLFSDYPAVWRAFERIVADLSEHERAALFRGSAVAAYRL